MTSLANDDERIKVGGRRVEHRISIGEQKANMSGALGMESGPYL